MNDSSMRSVTGRRAAGLLLALTALLALISLGCSLSQALVGPRGNAAATPTKTPRPTFTPLPALLAPVTPPSSAIRGVLPPGVTVQPPASSSAEMLTPGAGGDNNTVSLVIYATDTPAPAATNEPTRTPASLIDAEPEQPTSAGTPQPTPHAIVSANTVSGRRGPDPAFERVGQASQGTALLILGRTPDRAWWQVCCMANQPVWVPADSVEARGALDTVPEVLPPPTPMPTMTPLPRPPQPTRTPTPTPGLPFDIARGPEFPIQRDNGILTIWVKVYAGPLDNQTPLGGYILKVFRDGVDVSDNKVSSNGPFDSTGPFQGNYLYNLKFEMYNASEADWEIYLARPGGFRVSPITKFTTKGSSYRHLVVYMAYWLAR